MSVHGTTRTQADPVARPLSATADIRPRRQLPELTDAVEKVRDLSAARNNRIIGINFLNQIAPTALVFNQYCSETPSKSFFDSIDPEPTQIGLKSRSCTVSCGVCYPRAVEGVPTAQHLQ